MTDAEAKASDDRRVRIGELCDSLGKYKPASAVAK
jgi:hypothetical protein